MSSSKGKKKNQSYSEKYGRNHVNPYTGYSAPGAGSGKIYHPEAIDTTKRQQYNEATANIHAEADERAEIERMANERLAEEREKRMQLEAELLAARKLLEERDAELQGRAEASADSQPEEPQAESDAQADTQSESDTQPESEGEPEGKPASSFSNIIQKEVEAAQQRAFTSHSEPRSHTSGSARKKNRKRSSGVKVTPRPSPERLEEIQENAAAAAVTEVLMDNIAAAAQTSSEPEPQENTPAEGIVLSAQVLEGASSEPDGAEAVVAEPQEEEIEEAIEETIEDIEEAIEDIEEELEEESIEQPAEQSAEEVPEQPSDEAAEAVIAIELQEDEIEEEIEETIEDIEEAIEDIAEELGEQSAEQPAEQSAEEGSEQPTEENAEESAEQPAEEVSEEPVEEPAEESDKQPAEQPSEEISDEPAEESSEQPAEEIPEEPEDDVRVAEQREKPERRLPASIMYDPSTDAMEEQSYSDQDDTLFLRREKASAPTAVFDMPEGVHLPGYTDDDEFLNQWLSEGEDEMLIKDKRRRRRVSTVVGALTIVLALVGFGVVINFVASSLSGIGNTSGKNAEYESFVAPVVLSDPEPFETWEGADPQKLLECSILALTTAEGANYTIDDTNRIVIPSADVSKSARRLFGPLVELDLSALNQIEGGDLYFYSEADDCFHVAITGISETQPVIIGSPKREGDTITLVVGYLSQSALVEDTADEETEYYKTMVYVLTQTDSGYYISALREYTEG